MAASGQRSLHPVTPLDVVFSCCVCSKTLSEVYEDRDHQVGLHHEPNTAAGRVTKLYLTGCAHVVCAKHLDGGGAPFHPAGQLPKAPCPFCKDNKGDNTPQFLFRINENGAQDHDASIPQSYFDTPPGKLSEDGSDTEALRFQYVSILRFATVTYLKRQQAEDELANQKAMRDEEDRKQWTERTRKMQLLGKILTCTQNQLKRARDWLVALGQDVSSIDDALSYQNISVEGASTYQNTSVFDEDSIVSGESINARAEQERTAASTQRFEGQLRLARGSAADLEHISHHRTATAPQGLLPSNAMHPPSSLLPAINMASAQGQEHLKTLKRKGSDVSDNYQARKRYAPTGPHSPRMTSRDAMPPPQLPASRFTPQLFQNVQSGIPIDFGPPTQFSSQPTGYNTTFSQDRTTSQSPATATGHTSPFEFRSRDDGELDNLRFHHPTPQRPIYRPNSVSPARDRLTLTPRQHVQSRGTGSGLLSHVRSSSSNANTLTPHSMGSHRQQLGQSPYFGQRELPNRAPGSGVDARIVNGLSFLEDPVVGSGSGRRRARR